MTYCFSKNVTLSFDDAITRVTEELKKEGFGILTEIDVKSTLKTKLDVDFYNYRILGACNPAYAYKALQAEDKIGFCTKREMLLERTFQCCPDFEESKR